MMTFADRGCQGAGGAVWTPFNAALGAHARIRALGERAIATSKTWKILAKLRRCPNRATAIVQVILVLQAAQDARYSG
jgi:hypothetical protein